MEGAAVVSTLPTLVSKDACASPTMRPVPVPVEEGLTVSSGIELNDPRKLTEKQFSQQVVDLARLLGWKVYRTFNSRFSPAGYPDLTMVRGSYIKFAELKLVGKIPSIPQECWLSALYQAGLASAYIGAYLWTPDDWGYIVEVLR